MQVKLAELLVNPEDRRTKKDKFKSLGLPERTFYRWMKDPRYLDYINSLISQYTDGELADIWRALINQAKRGSYQHIKLYFELKDRFPLKELDIEEQKARIDKIRAEAERIKNPQGSAELPEDDGFLEALNAEAAAVWGDEDEA